MLASGSPSREGRFEKRYRPSCVSRSQSQYCTGPSSTRYAAIQMRSSPLRSTMFNSPSTRVESFSRSGFTAGSRMVHFVRRRLTATASGCLVSGFTITFATSLSSLSKIVSRSKLPSGCGRTATNRALSPPRASVPHMIRPVLSKPEVLVDIASSSPTVSSSRHSPSGESRNSLAVPPSGVIRARMRMFQSSSGVIPTNPSSLRKSVSCAPVLVLILTTSMCRGSRALDWLRMKSGRSRCPPIIPALTPSPGVRSVVSPSARFTA